MTVSGDISLIYSIQSAITCYRSHKNPPNSASRRTNPLSNIWFGFDVMVKGLIRHSFGTTQEKWFVRSEIVMLVDYLIWYFRCVCQASDCLNVVEYSCFSSAIMVLLQPWTSSKIEHTQKQNNTRIRSKWLDILFVDLDMESYFSFFFVCNFTKRHFVHPSIITHNFDAEICIENRRGKMEMIILMVNDIKIDLFHGIFIGVERKKWSNFRMSLLNWRLFKWYAIRIHRYSKS